jgi:hypothetical protein
LETQHPAHITQRVVATEFLGFHSLWIIERRRSIIRILARCLHRPVYSLFACSRSPTYPLLLFAAAPRLAQSHILQSSELGCDYHLSGCICAVERADSPDSNDVLHVHDSQLRLGPQLLLEFHGSRQAGTIRQRVLCWCDSVAAHVIRWVRPDHPDGPNRSDRTNRLAAIRHPRTCSTPRWRHEEDPECYQCLSNYFERASRPLEQVVP